ncbi:MAG: hypothetical protein GY854_33665 [Deltaproteobacteria bacterium]|nr:hypothetical protein [Deltaproteobacteria bacterium]
MPNTPDDWCAYWCYCERCHTRWHASDGGCECRPCEDCGALLPWWDMVDGEVCAECEDTEKD